MTPQNIRTAIILMKRATLTGEEARNASDAIAAFESMYDAVTNPMNIEDNNGNDA